MDRSMTVRASVGGGNRTMVMLYSGGAPASFPTVDMSGDTDKAYPAGMMIFDSQESTSFSGDVTLPKFEVDLASKVNDEYFLEFKADAIRSIKVTYVDFTAEDSQWIYKPTLSGNAVLCVAVTAAGVIGNLRRLTAYVCFVDPASLTTKYAAGALADAPIKLIGYPAPAQTVIDVATLSSGFGDLCAPASLVTMTIPANQIGVETDQYYT